MTKVRAPDTFQLAITRIAGRIGWEGCVAAVGSVGRIAVAERTVRNWSEPDTHTLPTLAQALALDLAFLRDGGGEAPIMATFGRLLDIEVETTADAAEIAEAGARVAVENGQAVAAIFMAAQPGAPARVKAHALVEIEEAQVALGDAKAKIRPTAAGP